MKKKPNLLQDDEKCPDCNGKLRYLPDEVYCRQCGLVVDDSPMDSSSEEFEFPANEKAITRTGKVIEYLDGCGGPRKLPPTLIGKKRKK
jgi:transcription initiation factor TFIIIB Brf1 subunit/transcription initiation factor TFIIB